MGPRYLADVSGIFTHVSSRTADPCDGRAALRRHRNNTVNTCLNPREGEAHPFWSHRVSMPCARTQGRERGGRWEGHHRTRAASTTLSQSLEQPRYVATSRALGKERESARAWHGQQTMTTASCINHNNNYYYYRAWHGLQTMTTTSCINGDQPQQQVHV